MPPRRGRGGNNNNNNNNNARNGGGSSLALIGIVASIVAAAAAYHFLYAPATAAAAGSDGPSEAALASAKLEDWARGEGIIGRNMPLRFRSSETTGRGIFFDTSANSATSKVGVLRRGSTLMCTPRNATWDRESLVEGTRLGRECAHLVGPETGVTAGAFKAFVAAATAAGAEEPEWTARFAPWLAAWPGRWDAPADIREDGLWQLPALWPQEDIAALQFPIALARMREEYEAVKTHVMNGCAGKWLRAAARDGVDVHGGKGAEIVVPVLADDGSLSGSETRKREDVMLGFDAFARAYALAQSRWFGSEAATREGATIEKLESRNPFDLDDFIFIPGIDAANHIKVAGGQAHGLRTRKDSSTCLVATADVSPGEELRLDYGASIPNRIFFPTYGFLNPDPRSESVLFTLPAKVLGGLERDPLIAPHVRPVLDILRFEIRRKNHASLLGLNRFVAAKLSKSLVEECFCGTDTDYPDYDECGVDADVDLRSRETVVTQLEGVLDALPTSLDEDRKQIMSMRTIDSIRTGRTMLALMFRLRLKGIVTTQLEAARTAVKDLKHSIKLGVAESDWKGEARAKQANGKKQANMEELREQIRKVLEEEDRKGSFDVSGGGSGGKGNGSVEK